MMAKLDQDNRLLAELKQKVRTANPTFKATSDFQQTSSLLSNNNPVTQLHSSLPSLNNTSNFLNNLSSYTNKNILSALETNNDLAQGYTGLNSLGLNQNDLTNLTNYNNLATNPTNLITSNLSRQALSQPTLTGTSALTSVLNNVAAQQQKLQQQVQQMQQQQLLKQQQTIQQPHLTSVTPNLSTAHQDSHHANEMRIAEDIVDSIEIANRGRFRAFIARYNYDPFKQSPNDHPEAELHLNAGDFILVQGEFYLFN